MPANEIQADEILFLSVNGSGNVTNADDLKVIRSHAAQVGHNRKQRRRLAQLVVRQYRPIFEDAKKDINNCQYEQGTATATSEVGSDEYAKWQTSALYGQAGNARLMDPSQGYPGPVSPIATLRRNPFEIYARSISGVEDRLLDHCKSVKSKAALYACVYLFHPKHLTKKSDITFVMEYGCTACNRGDGQELFQNLRAWWIPWAISLEGLLCGILMTACRSLVSLQPQNAEYSMALLRYKCQCIRITRDMLATEIDTFTDLIIALALVLANEEVSQLGQIYLAQQIAKQIVDRYIVRIG